MSLIFFCDCAKIFGVSTMQTLEVGEEKSRSREELLQAQIMDLIHKLKASEYRGENADMNIQRLNVRIDQIEEDLMQVKLTIKKSSLNSLQKKFLQLNLPWMPH